MNHRFFRRSGFLFIPRHFIGWLIALAALAYGVWAFIEIDGRSHSVSDTLINWVFNMLIVAAIYALIAYFTSNSAPEQRG